MLPGPAGAGVLPAESCATGCVAACSVAAFARVDDGVDGFIPRTPFHSERQFVAGSSADCVAAN
jgi:hypothetical protein